MPGRTRQAQASGRAAALGRRRDIGCGRAARPRANHYAMGAYRLYFTTLNEALVAFLLIFRYNIMDDFQGGTTLCPWTA